MTELDRVADVLSKRQLPEWLQAIDDAERALADLESGRREWEAPSPPATVPPARVERYFDRSESPGPPSTIPQAAPPKRSSHLLRAQWDAVRDRLQDHANRDLRQILPMCAAAGRDPRLRPGARDLVRQMLEEHRSLAESVAAVRLEAMLTPPVRREFVVVCSAFEEHRRVEESEIFALVLGDEEPLAQDLRQTHRSSEDIARQLRTSRPPQPALEPEPPTSALNKLLSVFRKK